MKVLLVDDEPLAVELLAVYVSRLPGAHLIGTCNNALEAFNLLSKQKADVIFLDINMPEIKGIDFLKMLKDPPYVIFTTAYTEYAAESYDYNVVDYLVKPITFERFMKSVHKLSNIMSVSNNELRQDNETLFVRTEGKMIRVDLQQLYFIEGYKNYVRLWTTNGKIIVHSTMKHFEEYLEQNLFFLRVHKSYIVNLRHVSEVSGTFIKVGNESIAIGATFRHDVLTAFTKYKQF